MIIHFHVVKSSRQYAFYKLSDYQNNLRYVGVCPAPQLLALPDVRGNAKFEQLFKDYPCVIEVVNLCDSKKQAMAAMNQWLRSHPAPEINRYFGPQGREAPIVCNETGEVFKNVKEIMVAHGVSESAMSKHLRGLPGAKSVKGKTYYRQVAVPVAVPLHTDRPSPPVAVPLHKRGKK